MKRKLILCLCVYLVLEVPISSQEIAPGDPFAVQFGKYQVTLGSRIDPEMLKTERLRQIAGDKNLNEYYFEDILRYANSTFTLYFTEDLTVVRFDLSYRKQYSLLNGLTFGMDLGTVSSIFAGRLEKQTDKWYLFSDATRNMQLGDAIFTPLVSILFDENAKVQDIDVYLMGHD